MTSWQSLEPIATGSGAANVIGLQTLAGAAADPDQGRDADRVRGRCSLQSGDMPRPACAFNRTMPSTLVPSVKQPVIYILHSGQMFGTERMALATLRALGTGGARIIVAPSGPVHPAAHDLNLRSVHADSLPALAAALAKLLREFPDAAVMATGVWHSLLVVALRFLLGCHGAHLHIVHGGTEERLSYGRKRWLNPFDVRFVAVSEFVRSRLLAHGVRADRIDVVENFLRRMPTVRRAPFAEPGVRRVVVVSRLDRIKRVGLLFDALDRTPALAELRFDIYGTGEEQKVLEARAQAWPNVRMHGFVDDAAAKMAEADLLLHTCPEEPFGLVLLEAFAAGVPVLVPNAGGAAGIVQDGVSGFHFTANNAAALGARLIEISKLSADRLNAIATGGKRELAERYRPEVQAARYESLITAAA
jgi:glycosyltransferase involved in cell wall biosynthesis